jgi:hypothetical protein
MANQTAFVGEAARNCLRDQEQIIVSLPAMTSPTLSDTYPRLSFHSWTAGTPLVITDQRVLILYQRQAYRSAVRVSEALASRPGKWLRPRWVITLIDAPARHEVDFVELIPRQPLADANRQHVDILVLTVRDQTMKFHCTADRLSDRLAIAVDTLSRDEAPRPV